LSVERSKRDGVEAAEGRPSACPLSAGSAPRGAVFLSYASQDAEAARRICESLRASGVEVWFDADGGLEHGDEWDAKIRKQIKECVLFIPIISANTQARLEGYFRIEWDLAAERARGIASGVPFILPVVIDETREPDALVPDRFRMVQWTKLPGGVVTPEVKARYLRLWSHRIGAAKHGFDVGRGLPTPPSGAATADAAGSGDPALQPTVGRRAPAAAWIAATVVALAVAVGFIALRPKPNAGAGTRPPTVEKPAAPASEAQRLVAKAWEVLLAVPEPFRSELETAGDFCRRATELDAAEADAWAAWAHVESWYIARGIDKSAARQESARAKAARALKLAPRSFEARLAHAYSLNFALGYGTTTPFTPEVERLLRELLQQKPDEPRALFALAYLLRGAERTDETVAAFERLAANPAWAAAAYNGIGWALSGVRRQDEAMEAAEKSIAARPFFGNLYLQLTLARNWFGDLDLAKSAAEKMPAAELREHEVAAVAVAELYWWRREPQPMLRLLQSIPRDWFELGVEGPKDYWTGLAHQLAGNAPAAHRAWRAALRLIDERLPRATNPGRLHALKAKMQLLLGDRPSAEASLAAMRESGGAASAAFPRWGTELLLGRFEQVQAGLARLNWAILRHSPEFDPVREDARFQALLAAAEKDPQRSPRARNAAAAAAPMPADQKSIAVLPFANMSPDPENAFFADGVHEDVITSLAKIRDLKVISRTSTLAYRDAAQRNLRKIAEELGVAAVLEGSVRRAGNKVRVTAKLIDARTDQSLWGDEYDGELNDIFALQATLAQKITTALRATLTPNEKSQIAQRPTQNQEAYDHFVRARLALESTAGAAPRRERFLTAVSLLEKAVALDPNFALAHALLVYVHGTMYWFPDLDPSLARAEKVKMAVDTAVRLAPDLPETRLAKGTYHFRVENDFERALTELKRAEAGLPNDPTLFFLLAWSHRRLGRWPEAVAIFEKGADVDPRQFSNAYFLLETLHWLRRYATAEDVAQRFLQRFANRESLYGLSFVRVMSEARFEQDGDAAAFLRRERERMDRVDRELTLAWSYWLSLLQRDYAGAERLLEGREASLFSQMHWRYGVVVAEPIPLARAGIAFLRGDAAAAQRHAGDALSLLQATPWNPRQVGLVRIATARAHAFAGHVNEALQELDAGFRTIVAKDQDEARFARELRGECFIALRRHDDAIAELRELMSGPSPRGPNEIRIDPFWSRLKDDPRFEEILKSAKPL
jgi:TolB-like protein/cytochrome c-type biogenesis protein CcmH/NrfG